MSKRYFLKYPKSDPNLPYCNKEYLGLFVAIDAHSGGYPFGVKSIFSADSFWSEEAAEAYRKSFVFMEVWSLDEDEMLDKCLKKV